MKYLMLLLALSTTAHAINITAPTEYNNGDALSAGDIRHYVICISLTENEDVCDKEIIVIGDVLKLSDLPKDTHHIRGKTVLTNGMVGDYGPRFIDTFRTGNPPVFSISADVILINADVIKIGPYEHGND